MSKQVQNETLNEVELEMVNGGGQGVVGVGPGGALAAWGNK